LIKPRFGWGGEIPGLAAPFKLQASGVQGVVGEDEAVALFVGEPAFDEGEIQVGVAAIYFIADDGVAKVGEVEADLVFAAGVGA
jgi:hypothetical protein